LLTMGSGPTVARIPIGTNGYVLTSNGTDAAWTAVAAEDFTNDQNILATQVFG
jgi:hypothetical protein